MPFETALLIYTMFVIICSIFKLIILKHPTKRLLKVLIKLLKHLKARESESCKKIKVSWHAFSAL